MVELGGLAVGVGDGEAELVDVSEPLVALGFVDLGFQVGADVGETAGLSGVDLEDVAADAGVSVDAGGAVGAVAGTEGDLALTEVLDELVPFLLGRFRYSSLGRSCRRVALNCS